MSRQHGFNMKGPATILALLALGACVTGGDAMPSCPDAQLAVPADRIGNNNEAGELRFKATLSELDSDCRLIADELEIDLSFELLLERGPAFEGSPVTLTYFLATLSPARRIIDKQLFETTLTLDPNEMASGVVETLTLRLPVPPDASNASHAFYVGFQPDLKDAR